MANYHVLKDKETGKWAAKREGAERAAALVEYQKEAEQLAKSFAANSGGGEVRIHRPTGEIRDSDTVSPARDPFPPRDKKY